MTGSTGILVSRRYSHGPTAIDDRSLEFSCIDSKIRFRPDFLALRRDVLSRLESNQRYGNELADREKPGRGKAARGRSQQ